MNERERAEQFSREVDNLLEDLGRVETEAAPESQRELLALARALAQIDLSAESAVRPSLRRRLLTGEAAWGGRSDSRGVRPMKSNAVRQALLTGLAGLALLVAMLMFSPTVRAAISEVVQNIGGLIFNQTNEFPDSADGPESIWPEETMTLADARAKLPFTFSLPAWTPDGYTLQDNVRVALPYDAFRVTHMMIAWEKQTEGESRSFIWLMVEYPRPADHGQTIIGPESVTEVSVNGEPAAIVYGAWNADTHEWGMTGLMTLSWRLGDVAYHLSAHDQFVTEEELIRIAESLVP